MSNLTLTSQQIKLNNRRFLGYTEYGDPQGKPILHFHGAHSSRLSAKILSKVATKLNARVIAIDRPGFGLSTFKYSRQILDWPDDVIQFADVMLLDRFSVIGVSSGGPYALACALKIPERLLRVGIVGCEFAYDMPGTNHTMHYLVRWFNLLARRVPLVMSMILWFAKLGIIMNLGRFVSRFAGMFPKPDRAIFLRPGGGQGFIENYLEAHRQGTRGAIWDMALVSSPWRIKLKEIGIEVNLWHGGADTVYPMTTAQYLAKTIPRCLFKIYPNEGHLSLLFNHTEEIIRTLV